MLNTGMIGAAVLIAGFAISCFASLLSFAQCRLSATYALLGCLFLAFMISDVSDMSALLLINPDLSTSVRFIMISFAASFFIPPVLLIYVRSLTRLPLLADYREGPAHLVLPVIAFVFALCFLALPAGASGGLLVGEQILPRTGFVVTIAVLTTILPFVFYMQCLVYSVLAFATELKHRERLKELFASTEPHEIRWITGMAVIFGTFAVLNLLSLISSLLGFQIRLSPLVDGVIELLIVLILAIWGLRQAPGIVGQPATSNGQDLDAHIKYEKSALDTERAARISGKLNTAMERDQLFRDPNLSLMTLSRHIGVSTNYVSQSLNEYLGVSFFDFVNGWRVEASKPIILSGGQPITVIAYDVGFNSRSSFYTAFKKNTGMTPRKFNEQDQGYAAGSIRNRDRQGVRRGT